MRDVITGIIIFTGLMVGCGLAFRRQRRSAAVSEQPVATKPARQRPFGTVTRKRVRVAQPRHLQTNFPANRHWLRRLKCEEQRQRPQEGRN
jgi:hypothetical protein